ncbi:MAG: hypothetical protein CVV49_13575 [Spirochaetae bacterium HGW-Spirochaetae-5]|nr:MAG: hypothetical protein CVV49_13575 [Spirochaetae bacterium HGW-Spirochaetae-5]
MISHKKGDDFFGYWESLGFFENIQVVIPPQFMLLFEIARTLFSDRTSLDALSAIEQISTEEKIHIPDRTESISINRIERQSPLSDKMEIETYKNIIDLKRTLPRELAHDDDIFNAKLFTKTLMVQKYYESEADHFKPISTMKNESGREANKFEQLFYILLDTSRSMDMKMRGFYAKCIVSEFLRRKLDSNAKLFFRTFDTNVGALHKIEKKEDYPYLIEKVLLSTTGGVSTNLAKAVYQAVSDINYTKDMANAEILVVTDGASKIDVHEMLEKLGKIKLHILKIGDDLPEPDFYDMKSEFANERVDFDPSSINIKQIKNRMQNPKEDDRPLSPTEKRIYSLMLDGSNNIFKDLKKVSKNYIEVGDIKTDKLYDASYENLENIFHWVKKLEHADFRYMKIDEKERVYKQAYFLGQYLKMLHDQGSKNKVELKAFIDRVAKIKSKLMEDNELFLLIVKSGKYHEDKKKLKLDRKEARKLIKQMKFKNEKITIKDMKRAQLTFSFQPGEGSAGKLFLMLIIKLGQFIGSVVTYPFTRSKKRDDEKYSGIEYSDDDKKQL